MDKSYDHYDINSDEKRVLNKRFTDLIAYREQVATYNASYYDPESKLRIGLNDLPHMVYSYRDGHNFDKGGRVYYAVNSIHTPYRESIEFNKKSTIELDFKCSLPSILLQSVGKRAIDLYSFTGFGEQYRNMFKKITVAILGADNKKSVQSALINHFNKEWWKMHNGEIYDHFWLSKQKEQTKEEVIIDIKRCCKRAIEAYEHFPKVREQLFRGKDVVGT